MYDKNADISPFNVLPPVVAALALVISGIEILFQLGGAGLAGGATAVGWRLEALQDYAFSGLIWDQMWARGFFPAEHMIRFFSYPFLHGSFTHAAFAVVILLAIGKAVGEVFSALSVVIVFFASSAVGALAYAMLTDAQAPLFGAYPAGYGLIGAFTFLLWVNLAAVGANSMRAFTLIGFLMVFQLVFGLLFGAGYDWIADLAGFATGFGLSFVLSPGGYARVLAKMRQR